MSTDVGIPQELIERSILLVRGQKVMLDEDLAELYGVEIRVLNQAVKRNSKRFPDDFMFQLMAEEYTECQALRSHFVILKGGRGQHRKYLPQVFTEQGVAMLSSVLNSDRAIDVNIQIMRAFVKLRELVASNRELSLRLDELEQKYDVRFSMVFDAIRQLMTPPETKKRKIGFGPEE
ncbi:MAG: ORF6N domain-containing protein [Desulfuromonadales bacterium]|nr:ORF6N domain-containing protein [Desulfuromonadales bacterium]